MRRYDVVIVGGGASGLAAAVELGMSSPELSVLVIEKMQEPARKLRATGSGRCNITNTEAEGYDRIMRFFTSIGLITRRYSNGLVYPYSESAADVAELLIYRASTLGAKLACGEEVISVKKDREFAVESVYKDKDGEHRITTYADYVILACGGKAGPTYGTTGDGYRMAKELGHSIVTPVPALTGIECAEWDESEEPDAHMLAGTRTSALVSLYKRDPGLIPSYEAPYFRGDYSNLKPLFREEGEVQFTKYGLSGICIFNMSRYMRLDKSKGESMDDYLIKLNLFPDAGFADYASIIAGSRFAGDNICDMLCTLIKKPLAVYAAAQFENSGCDAGRALKDMDHRDIMTLCEIVHGLEFYPVALRGWKDAQLTSGGVSTDEIDEFSSESCIVPQLYITGELADRDYPCGGFNLSNAWLSGLDAADDIADMVK